MASLESLAKLVRIEPQLWDELLSYLSTITGYTDQGETTIIITKKLEVECIMERNNEH